MKQEVKKLLILNLPYLLFVYLFDKIGAAIRLTPGADASEKLLQLGTGFAAAFSSIAPSLHPADCSLSSPTPTTLSILLFPFSTRSFSTCYAIKPTTFTAGGCLFMYAAC